MITCYFIWWKRCPKKKENNQGWMVFNSSFLSYSYSISCQESGRLSGFQGTLLCPLLNLEDTIIKWESRNQSCDWESWSILDSLSQKPLNLCLFCIQLHSYYLWFFSVILILQITKGDHNNYSSHFWNLGLLLGITIILQIYFCSLFIRRI